MAQTDTPAGAAEGGATGEAAPAEKLEVTSRDVVTAVAMGLMFIAAQLLALLMVAPFEASNIRAFENPEDPKNPLIYFAIIIGFTLILLWLAKLGYKWVIKGVILGAIGATMVYVLWPFVGMGLLAVDPTLGERPAGLGSLGLYNLAQTFDLLLSLAIAGGLTWLLYRYPEWWVVDSVGILVSAGAIAIFGISFGVIPALILLVGLAIYDFIAVYRTRHMLALADNVMDLKLPIMLVVPRSSGYSFLEESGQLSSTGVKKRREAMFMGLGDIVIPSVLVVSAYVRPDLGFVPAMGALLGTLAGYAFLMFMVLRGQPHAGLPSLNGGSILGFLVGTWIATGSVVFW